ncbi:FkbM family methyltransferase [Saccharopolyspora shandongensis]|uniref:FkbM family methyltransferase n=1 Tax=Saccharopolyspora shandongensis TaxID=418495 RepID=UPI0034040868
MSDLDLVEVAEGFECYTPATGNPVLTEAKLIYAEIFGRNTYLSGLAPIDPKGLVVDAGANIGLFTLFIKHHYPEASVLAVEPIPHNVEALRANLRHHDVSGVTVHPTGLSDAPGTTEFYFFPSMPGNSTAHLAEKLKDKQTVAKYANPTIAEQLYRNEAVRISTTPLSDLLPPNVEIDLIKMDIEGSEEAALAGIEDQDWKRIKQLAIEVHETRSTLDKILKTLTDRGFEARAQTPEEAPKGIDNRIVYATRP